MSKNSPDVSAASEPLRLGLSAKLGYASGNLGKSIQWNTVDFLYLYFLTDLIGLSPGVAGLIILVSLVWDGVSDPLVGYLIDRFGARVGSYQRLVIWFAPIAALGFMAIFLLPLMATGSVIACALLAGLLFRTGYTLVDVPHNALLADLTRDSRERATLSAWRFFFSALGSVTLSLAILPALLESGMSDRSGFVGFALVAAVVYLAVMWTSALSCQNGASLKTRQPEGGHLGTALSRLARNRELVLMALIAAVTALLIPVFAKLSIFYAKSWIGAPAAATTLIIAYALGQLVSLPAWLALSHRFEKRGAALLAHGVLVFTCVGFAVTLPREMWTTAAFFAAAGFAFGGINTMNWALIPDTVEYTEAQSGRRHEALTFGLFLLVMKVFAGLSMALTGWALDSFGYGGDDHPPGDALAGIPIIMVAAPIIGAAICSALLTASRMSHDGHGQVARPGKKAA